MTTKYLPLQLWGLPFPVIRAHNNKSIIHHNKSITHYNKSITHYKKSITHYNKSITHYNKSITHYNNSITHYNNSITLYNNQQREWVQPNSCAAAIGTRRFWILIMLIPVAENACLSRKVITGVLLTLKINWAQKCPQV